MSTATRLDRLLADAGTTHREIGGDTKMVVMSDCHRGTGGANDEFAVNADLYQGALQWYLDNNYTYVELGDGDELWENLRLGLIRKTYPNVFSVLCQFAVRNRLFFIIGNHDTAKRLENVVRRVLKPFESLTGLRLPSGLGAREAIILTDRNTGSDILLVHGHQGSLLSDLFWPISWFVVRYVWRPLQWLGVKDPTLVAHDQQKQDSAERRMREWAADRRRCIVAGHTHRERFPDTDDPPYFNTGSALVPGKLPAIEIADNEIALVHWVPDGPLRGVVLRNRIRALPLPTVFGVMRGTRPQAQATPVTTTVPPSERGQTMVSHLDV
jgi:UDP-2,3-diacylglucosamine pyrophosphatase LpxH